MAAPQAAPYARVYYSVMDDPKFDGIRDDCALFGAWSLLLVVAEMAYPSPAFIPPAVTPELVTRLVEAGLVDELSGHRFRIHGLEAERGRRSAAGRAGGLASGESRRSAERPFSTPIERSLNDRSTNVPDRSTSTSTSTRTSTRTRTSGSPPAPAREGTIVEPPLNDRSTDVEDLAVDYYRLTNRFPGPKVTPWLDRIEAEFGYTAASRALAEQVIANSEPHTLLGRVDAVLKTAQRNAAKAGQLAEKAKLEKWAEEHSITPEQAAENQRRVAEVRQEMFGSMLDRQAPFGAARKEATG